MTHTGLCSPDHVTAAKKLRNRSTRRSGQCLRQAGIERRFARDSAFASVRSPLTLLRPPASGMTVSIRQRVRWLSWGASIGFRGTACATPGIYSPPTGWRCALPVQIEQELQVFFYLPFEHSEDLEDENRAVRLCYALLDAEAIRYAHIHQNIVTARLGRLPHPKSWFWPRHDAGRAGLSRGGRFRGLRPGATDEIDAPRDSKPLPLADARRMQVIVITPHWSTTP